VDFTPSRRIGYFIFEDDGMSCRPTASKIIFCPGSLSNLMMKREKGFHRKFEFFLLIEMEMELWNDYSVNVKAEATLRRPRWSKQQLSVALFDDCM